MNENLQHDDRLFEILTQEPDDATSVRAPARLKSRIYSALVRQQETSGPLLSLAETRAKGSQLCVFEDLWQRATSAGTAQCFNCCSLCHARVLAEHFERAPIYWSNCPYVGFGRK